LSQIILIIAIEVTAQSLRNASINAKSVQYDVHDTFASITPHLSRKISTGRHPYLRCALIYRRIRGGSHMVAWWSIFCYF